VRRRAAVVYDETLIDLTGAPPISVGVAGEVLGLPVWEEDEELDGNDEDDADSERTISLTSGHEAMATASGSRSTATRTTPATEQRPPTTPRRPHRDTTPPSGMRRVEPSAPDELDLAGLVASVDDSAAAGAGAPAENDDDAPEAPRP
jgi:hypothetical protein